MMLLFLPTIHLIMIDMTEPELTTRAKFNSLFKSRVDIHYHKQIIYKVI